MMLGSYAPTLVEVLIVLGVPSLGALAFMALGSKLLVPVVEKETKAVPAGAELEMEPQLA